MSRASVSIYVFLYLLVLYLGTTAVSTVAAAGIDARLQAELAATGDDEPVPVIITLSDKVDLKRFRDRDRKVRRKRMVTALKDKAAVSQRGLRAFLRRNSVTGVRPLWLINALAASMPASLIRKVERHPVVESIHLDETVSLPVMGAAIPDMTIDDVTVDESAGNAVFTVSLSVSSGDTVTVDYSTADGSAFGGFDYTAVSGTLTFLPGETAQPVVVPILHDTGIENDETFTVQLSAVVNANLIDSSGSGIIQDDDMPRLGVDDVSVDESAGTMVFTVTRSGSTAQAVYVTYATVDDTATAGSDYTAVTAQITIGVGVTSYPVSVPISDDGMAEGDETLIMTLSNPFFAEIDDASGTGTIIDNDMPVLSIDDVGVTESGGNAVFTVTRAGDTGTPVMVDFATSDDTAVAGMDYTAVSGQLNFAMGETSQTIIVPVTPDLVTEGDETFIVELNNPSSGSVIVDGSGTGTIFGTQPPAGITMWNLDNIFAPDTWAQGYIGQGVVVANMDSGVDITNPDLATRWRGGTNSWYDVHGQHPLTPFDADGHGTRSMGLMVSAGDASGIATGVAPGARWIAVKVWNDNGEALTSHFTQGFQWLLDPDGDPATDDAPQVVNNSWGFDTYPGGCNYIYQASVQALQAAGIAVVFSAGNSGATGAGTSVSPANYPEGYAVGAVDDMNNIAAFSSRGPSACDGSLFPEVVAPGVQVWTTDLSLGGAPSVNNQATGTSFSAPHVAGAMAVLLSAFPDSGVADLEDALINSATDLGVPGPDNDYGFGLINVLGAYSWLATDSDGDGVRDVNDNCIDAPNGPLIPDAGGYSQRDTDGDGYGNLCDADLTNDNSVNIGDLFAFKAAFGSADADADFNGDGMVNVGDLVQFKSLFGLPPGPSCCGIPLP